MHVLDTSAHIYQVFMNQRAPPVYVTTPPKMEMHVKVFYCNYLTMDSFTYDLYCFR